MRQTPELLVRYYLLKIKTVDTAQRDKKYCFTKRHFCKIYGLLWLIALTNALLDIFVSYRQQIL